MSDVERTDAPPNAETEALQATIDALLAENQSLRAENTRLQNETEEVVRERMGFLSAVLEHSPINIYAKDTKGRHIFVNRHAQTLFGMKWEQIRGKTDHELLPKDLADNAVEADRRVLESGAPAENESTTTYGGTLRHFITTKFPLRDPDNVVLGVCSITTDITVFKEAELQNRRLQEEVIRAQDATLRALSTPLLPIAKGVVVMPLIGYVDRIRAQRVLEVLLDGVVNHEASMVILDVTGVPIVDAEVASAVVKTARAAKLLGAKVVLTGIQPEIARTLVELAADLTDVVTQGTLEGGIAFALRGAASADARAAWKRTAANAALRPGDASRLRAPRR